MPQAFNPEKAKELICYLASKVDIGKTKLMKLLYLIDFKSYERNGKAVTCDEYVHWPLGPVPRNVWTKFQDLTDGICEQRKEDRAGKQYTKLVPKQEASLAVFSAEELEIIEEVINSHGKKTGTELVEELHREFTYAVTKNDEVIPYFMAPYRKYEPLSKAQMKRLVSDRKFMSQLKKAYAEAKEEMRERRSAYAA